MFDGFTNNLEEPPLETRKKSKCFLFTTFFVIIILIGILILLIYLLVHFNDVTIHEDKEENKSQQKSKRAPIIGITGMRIPDENAMLETDQTEIHNIESIEKSGGIPITLPVLETFNREVIKRQVELIDGLLIQGGLDVDPSLYHEELKEETGMTNLQTDNFIIEVIKQAFERKIPIFGICRGIQILNVAFGGNLYQDLKYAGTSSDLHRQDDSQLYKHTINVIKDTMLSKMFPNNDTLLVNSYHHQAIKDLAPNFIIDAKSNDGIIEAIHFNSNDQWIFGVQFHPEIIMSYNNDFMPIFSEFISQARKSQLY